jgi:SAM-dependent methyltransferase
MTSLHHAARTGFSKEAKAYARGRPEYPVEIETWLAESLAIGPGTSSVDVGAGTGKFTRVLQALGGTVIAIEPIEAMREEIVRSLPNVRALPGTADALPLADQSVDAVLCAQAFHWFAKSSVLDEFHRVLKPEGALGLVWNVRDESVDWVRRLTEIVTPYEGDAPRFYKGDWRKPFPHPGFGPLVETHFAHVHEGPPEQVIVERFLSVSFIAALPETQKNTVRKALIALIEGHPDLKGRSVVRFPYTACAFVAIREG